MFKIYIRPILEYNSCVWSPRWLKDIDLIESIQRSFTRRIPGLSEYSYTERLRMCSLESLEIRRIKEDIFLTYKIIHNLVDLPFSNFFEFVETERTRGHAFRLYPVRRRTDLALCSYSGRVINVWNSLPDPVAGARCLSALKCLLESDSSFLAAKYIRGRALYRGSTPC